MTYLFLLLTNVITLPVIETINIDMKDSGAAERTVVGLRVLTTVTTGGEAVFPEKEKKALETTLKSCCSFPGKLAESLIRKQLHNRRLDWLVILTGKGIFVVGKKTIHGPFQPPAPRGALNVSLTDIFLKKNQAPVKRENKDKYEKTPWWKNWIFWTGVVAITSGVIVFSVINQTDDNIDVHLKYIP
ncbi:MAG: hypothetical protein JXR95_05435 [Deltaproteobacteria bacterium]|nr:hypothetical protein [Deltaproteobacteria bacterium]